MLKLLLGRILPAGLAAGLLTGALSPLQPALQAFAVAADALSGDASAGGVDMPVPEDLPADGGAARAKGFFASLFGSRDENNYARREIAGLAEKMKARSEEKARENVAKMGKKAKPEGKKGGGKPKGSGKAGKAPAPTAPELAEPGEAAPPPAEAAPGETQAADPGEQEP